jgi:hypothetical protein
VEQLAALVKAAGYRSVVEAVAKHTVFLHPGTVAQTNGYALFPVIRNRPGGGAPGRIGSDSEGRRVLLDDNLSPTNAFLWSGNVAKGRDVQYNHLWTQSQNRATYTALWNLCATPAFLAKTTDGSNHSEVGAALRYRAFDLYGHHPADDPTPAQPDGYGDLVWAAHPPPLADLEATLRRQLRAKPKSRTTIACREIGWLFSGWEPDTSL